MVKMRRNGNPLSTDQPLKGIYLSWIYFLYVTWVSFLLSSYRDDVPKKKTLEMSFEDANIHLNDKQNDLETENVKMTEKIEIVGISTTIRTPSLVNGSVFDLIFAQN